MGVKAVEGFWSGIGGQVEASFYHARGPAGNPILFVSFSAVLIWLCPSLEGNEREQGHQSPEILGPLEKVLGHREVAKKQSRMWPTVKWNSRVRVVTEGTK